MPENISMQRIRLAIKELDKKGYIDSRVFEEDETINSKRTLSRFIRDLKEIIPIEYNRASKRYIKKSCADEVEDVTEELKKINSGRELEFFCSFVRSIIRSGSLMPPVSPAENAEDYRSITRMLEKALDSGSKNLYDKIEYHFPQDEERKRRVHYYTLFTEISSAFKTDKMLKFTYRSMKVTVQPVKILNYCGSWYLAALKKENESLEPAAFSFSEIESIRIDEEYKSFNAAEPESSVFIELIMKI
ncbi:MAG: WYL domain-containing protein [Candidatus Delongbacteria bacterium]|jgi:predicted DNA-binding transcriptional regulator YafY|nr:WYL domain-containing protein [Candidatus Delongbacteria bacterium]